MPPSPPQQYNRIFVPSTSRVDVCNTHKTDKEKCDGDRRREGKAYLNEKF